MQNMSGQTLGNYELRERIGRGGMAEVYKAYQPSMDRFVAIKVMLGHLAEDDTFIERFKREARAVGRLRHPHIIDIFDFGIGDDVYYMAMEYLTDGNLKEYIEENKQLPIEDSIKIARDLADALAYAHKAGMIHRDLKPANVMFIDKEQREVVLTDFGIARIINATGLTGTGMSVGTPSYMSPEAGGGDDTDERADIYALGIILYEMLVGQVPYNADTPLAVIMKHISAPLPTRDDYGDAIPESVELVMLRCLAKSPDDRFSTAAELRDALDKVLQSLSTESADEDKTQVAADNATRVNDNDDALTSIQQSPQISATVASSKQSEKVKNEPIAETRTGNSYLVPLVGITLIALIITGLAYFFFSGDDNTLVNDTPIVEALTESSVDLSLGGDLPPNAINLDIFSNINDVMNEAEALLYADNWEGAVAYVADILADDPSNEDALFAQAQLYVQRYDEDNIAGQTAQELIDINPESVWGYIALSDSFLNYPLYDEDDAVDNARDALDQAEDLEPDNPHILWRLARIGEWELVSERLASAEENGASGADFIYEIGKFLYYDDSFSRAIPYWETFNRYAESETGRARDSFWFLVDSLIQNGEPDVAYDYLINSEFVTTASDANTFGSFAYIAFQASEFEQARDWSNAALAFSADANAARFVQAQLVYWYDGDTDAAIEQLTQLAEEDAYFSFARFSGTTDAYLEAARILADDGQNEEAIDYYTRTIESNSGLPFVYEERANVYIELDDTESARSDLQQALNITDDNELQMYYRDRIIDLGPITTDE
ncbi:MAG: protein kinase [Phototrophicaceae bacterium]